MAKATFRLQNTSSGEQLQYSVEIGTAVSDEWWQAVQDYFCTIPPASDWPGVHRYYLQINEDREIAPSE